MLLVNFQSFPWPYTGIDGVDLLAMARSLASEE